MIFVIVSLVYILHCFGYVCWTTLTRPSAV